MRRRDKVYIASVLFFQFKEYFAKALLCHIPADLAARNAIVLAIDATEITPRKEDGARAFFTRYAGLLPIVKRGTGKANGVFFAAEAGFYISVDPAPAGTNIAFFHFIL